MSSLVFLFVMVKIVKRVTKEYNAKGSCRGPAVLLLPFPCKTVVHVGATWRINDRALQQRGLMSDKIVHSSTITFPDAPFIQFNPVISCLSSTICFAIRKILFWHSESFKSFPHSFCFFSFAEEITLWSMKLRLQDQEEDQRTWREIVREDCQARKMNKEDAIDRCK